MIASFPSFNYSPRSAKVENGLHLKLIVPSVKHITPINLRQGRYWDPSIKLFRYLNISASRGRRGGSFLLSRVGRWFVIMEMFADVLRCLPTYWLYIHIPTLYNTASNIILGISEIGRNSTSCCMKNSWNNILLVLGRIW